MKSTSPQKRKVTLSLEKSVYEGIRNKVGQRGVGAFLSELAKPHVLDNDLESSYKALAKARQNNLEAKQWLEGTEDDIDAPNVWRI